MPNSFVFTSFSEGDMSLLYGDNPSMSRRDLMKIKRAEARKEQKQEKKRAAKSPGAVYTSHRATAESPQKSHAAKQNTRSLPAEKNAPQQMHLSSTATGPEPRSHMPHQIHIPPPMHFASPPYPPPPPGYFQHPLPPPHFHPAPPMMRAHPPPPYQAPPYMSSPPPRPLYPSPGYSPMYHPHYGPQPLAHPGNPLIPPPLMKGRKRTYDHLVHQEYHDTVQQRTPTEKSPPPFPSTVERKLPSPPHLPLARPAPAAPTTAGVQPQSTTVAQHHDVAPAPPLPVNIAQPQEETHDRRVRRRLSSPTDEEQQSSAQHGTPGQRTPTPSAVPAAEHPHPLAKMLQPPPSIITYSTTESSTARKSSPVEEPESSNSTTEEHISPLFQTRQQQAANLPVTTFTPEKMEQSESSRRREEPLPNPSNTTASIPAPPALPTSALPSIHDLVHSSSRSRFT